MFETCFRAVDPKFIWGGYGRMLCPKCGATIQDKLNPTCYNCLRIENEAKRYGHRRSTAPYRRGSQASSSVELEPPEPATRPVPGNEATAELQRRQRQGINRLLHDMYGSDTYLSDILRDHGVRSDQIELLQQQYLDAYLNRLIQELHAWLKKIFPWQNYEALCHIYQLRGQPFRKSAALMKAYDIAPSKREVLHRACLQQLRLPSRRQELEKRIVYVARVILGGPGSHGRRRKVR